MKAMKRNGRCVRTIQLLGHNTAPVGCAALGVEPHVGDVAVPHRAYSVRHRAFPDRRVRRVRHRRRLVVAIRPLVDRVLPSWAVADPECRGVAAPVRAVHARLGVAIAGRHSRQPGQLGQSWVQVQHLDETVGVPFGWQLGPGDMPAERVARCRLEVRELRPRVRVPEVPTC